ncbi:MAG: formate/nitrite transporter family protein [Laribacter sp.]|nr:formate/nitrite transporter family protein [Laribacter sp.]MBP9527530.1 formate/nitrite transporter family protein [Laribacter sp.]MBP9608591.1 formate/nitrite transporter family protein [Laribacter sp.]
MTRPVDSDDPTALLPLSPERVIDALARAGRARVLDYSFGQLAVLGLLGGALITSGAWFMVLLSSGIHNEGLARLLGGFGFSAGFFLVILSHSALFTEVNIILPLSLLSHQLQCRWRDAFRFWGLTLVTNLIGAVCFAWMVSGAQHYSPETLQTLRDILGLKLAYYQHGGWLEWWRIVLSAMLANWMVGLATAFAFMAPTIPGKYIPVFLAVTFFDAANFQHSPANMGFFSLASAAGVGVPWDIALGWSILPAALGNILGAVLFVVLPLNFAFRLVPPPPSSCAARPDEPPAP